MPYPWINFDLYPFTLLERVPAGSRGRPGDHAPAAAAGALLRGAARGRGLRPRAAPRVAAAHLGGTAGCPAVVAGPPASAAAPATDASAAGAGLCSAAVQHNLDLQQAWSHAWHLDSQPSELKSGGKFFESLTATTLCSESLGCSTRTRSVSENQGIAFLCTQWVHACGFFSK